MIAKLCFITSKCNQHCYAISVFDLPNIQGGYHNFTILEGTPTQSSHGKNKLGELVKVGLDS